MKNIIKTTIAIAIIFITCNSFAQGNKLVSKNKPEVSKELNPNFDPNKKLVNKRTTPLINRDRKSGESLLNTNREPLFNRKYIPKKYTKAAYYNK